MDHQARPRICVIAGTRPEFIKLAPVIHALRRHPDTRQWQLKLIATGQHPDLTADLCRELDLVPDAVLTMGTSVHDLTEKAGHLLSALAQHLPARPVDLPDYVIVQGDTVSALAGAIAGVYGRHVVVHVEAGLRSGCQDDPFPEEINRRLIAGLAALHFAPTPSAVSNLLVEGVDPGTVACVGNTVIDAVHLYGDGPAPARPRPYVLATCHRRENWQDGLIELCNALRTYVRCDREHDVLFALHPNPTLRALVKTHLHDQPRIHLLDPQPYRSFLGLLRHAAAVVTDSGGVQEEASALGVPLVLCRKNTERPEILGHGGYLAGTRAEFISAALSMALEAPRPPHGRSPFGDGFASERIVTALARHAAGQRPYLASTELFDPNRLSYADVPLNYRKAFAIGTGLW